MIRCSGGQQLQHWSLKQRMKNSSFSCLAWTVCSCLLHTFRICYGLHYYWSNNNNNNHSNHCLFYSIITKVKIALPKIEKGSYLLKPLTIFLPFPSSRSALTVCDLHHRYLFPFACNSHVVGFWPQIWIVLCRCFVPGSNYEMGLFAPLSSSPCEVGQWRWLTSMTCVAWWWTLAKCYPTH